MASNWHCLRGLGLAGLALAWSLGAQAGVAVSEDRHCDLNFGHDFTVSEAELVVAQARPLRFTRDGDISLDGQPLALSDEQRQLAANYAQELQALVPELLRLVKEALKLVAQALGETFAELFGPDSEATVKIERAVAMADQRFAEYLVQADGRYQIKASRDDLLDAAFDEEFDAAVEEAAQASVGAGLSLVWKAMTDPDFGARMEAFGERMERDVGAAGEKVAARGESLCRRAERASALESKLRESVPELAHFSLVNSQRRLATSQGD